MIVTVTSTIMDGTAVRWYRSMAAAEIHRPVLAASRNGVKVFDGVYLNEISPEWIASAMQAYETLRADPKADVSHLATHVNRGPSNGPLVPVEEAPGG